MRKTWKKGTRFEVLSPITRTDTGQLIEPPAQVTLDHLDDVGLERLVQRGVLKVLAEKPAAPAKKK